MRYWMADKWTIGSNNEGLYNGINPSRKRGEKEKRKKEKGNQETTTAAPEKKLHLKKFTLSKIKPLGFNYSPLKPPKPPSSDVKS